MEEEKVEKTKNRPCFETRVGPLRVAIWENGTGKDKRPWFNTTVMRRYSQNGEPRETPSLTGLGDLALAAEAIRVAQAWIRNREQENRVAAEAA